MSADAGSTAPSAARVPRWLPSPAAILVMALGGVMFAITVTKGVQDPEFKATMAKLDTPINYLDAPDFKKFWDNDARRLAVTVQRVGKVEARK